MNKSFIVIALASLAAGLSAQEWQYPSGDGGYSYDENGIYTDSKGFTIFENGTWDGLDWSGKTASVDAKDSSGRNPVKYPNSLTFSTLTIGASTITNSDFSNSSYSATCDYSSLSAFLLYNDSTLENVDFSGSKFSHTAENPNGYVYVTVYLMGTLKNVDFSNSEFYDNTAATHGAYVFRISGHDYPAENINLSSTKFNIANIGAAVDLDRDVKNINMDNIEVNAPNGFAFTSNGNVIDGLSAKNAKIIVWADHPYVWIDSARNTFRSTDFRGATVNGKSFAASDIADAGENINTLLGDGEIFSNDSGSSVNKGLLLAEGDTFTISAHEVSAKLTVDSTLTGGTIDIKDGGLLELADGVTLTLTDAVDILFDAGAAVDSASDLIALGENATVVMAGYESDEAAQAAFVGLFKDSDGNGVDWSPSTVADFVVAGGAVPEPAACAALLGALALAFAAYKKRK